MGWQYGALQEFDFSVEEAAHDLGATVQGLRMVTSSHPSDHGWCELLIFPCLSTCFVITYFNFGAQSTLPMVIWSMPAVGDRPLLERFGDDGHSRVDWVAFPANRFGRSTWCLKRIFPPGVGLTDRKWGPAQRICPRNTGDKFRDAMRAKPKAEAFLTTIHAGTEKRPYARIVVGR